MSISTYESAAVDSVMPRRRVRAANSGVVSFGHAGIVRALLVATAIVLSLGFSREVYLAAFGPGTILQDLRHFALDSEHTLPSWYASLLFVLAASLLGSIASFARREGDLEWPRWALLALVFSALAVDESVSFHETLIKPLNLVFGSEGIFYFAWIVPGVIGAALLGLYFLPFLLRLPRRHGLRFAGCGAIFVSGALGMEMVCGTLAAWFGMEAQVYIFAAVVEETLEFVGLTLFVCALLVYARERFGSWAIRVD